MPARRAIAPWVLGWVAAIVLIVMSLLVGGLRIRGAIAASFEAVQEVHHAQSLLFGMIKAQLDEETGLRGYVATRDPKFLEPYRSARAQLPTVFLQLTSALHRLGLSSNAVADARRSNALWLEAVGKPLAEGQGRSSLLLEQKGKALVDRFRGDRVIVDRELAIRDAQLRRKLEGGILLLGVLIAGAAASLLIVGLAFVTLAARAWARLERLRELREQAAERESSLRAAYEAEKHTVDALQQVFSQRLLPTVQGISFSAIYKPAAEEAKVGGDWYDAFELGTDRILVVIGDTAGHGLEAAGSMSRLRDQVFAAALYDPDVESILRRVNAILIANSLPTLLVTMVVGIVNARTREFTYTSAGHPPPVLVEPNRGARLLAFGGLPLGVLRNAGYRTTRVQAEPGSMLVLYTDGAVEHSRNIVEGERILLETAEQVLSSNNPARAIYSSIFGDRVAADDVAILTVGFVEAATPETATSARAAPVELQRQGS
jgi:serine phosphatase RsbU (regulator of sigma subunit)